jgi:nitrate/nitrite transport system permease protein
LRNDDVWQQAGNLISEHQAERRRASEFYERQEKRNQARLDADPTYEVKVRPYTGSPTFFDQIWTSLYTVFIGFVVASVIAIPLGIVCGLSQPIYAAINPLIQLFKPVSPLAWLPLVTMIVSAVYVSDNPMFAKSFLTSALTVALCCLWPTLINTAVGVSSIPSDLVNVSRVLRLNALTHVIKIVLPSSFPMIFTGLRLSLGIGWMVLIAAEMLAQNPGLGKFVWDEFQNGSSESLARIMVAVLVIGLIGFALDRLMLALQRKISWDKNAILR